MPSKNNYRHYNLSSSKRNVLNVNNFGGLDVSNQKFNVTAGRAIDAQNFIFKDGVLQVREGHEEICAIPVIEYIPRDFYTDEKVGNDVIKNSVNFNGIWRFIAEDNKPHIIAHVGNLLFEVKNFGTKRVEFVPLKKDNVTSTGILEGETVTRPLLYKYENFKSFAFVGAKKLWFLGGNKYMVIRFLGNEYPLIELVENNDNTFIPKTTIGITYTNARVGGRESLDYPNMMTIYRKNTLLSGVGKEETSSIETDYFEYPLDGRLYLTKTKEDLESGSLSEQSKKELSKIEIKITERGEI